MEAVQEFPKGFFFIRCKAVSFAMDVNGGSMIVCSYCLLNPRKIDINLLI
jgi:hypothetical protein